MCRSLCFAVLFASACPAESNLRFIDSGTIACTVDAGRIGLPAKGWLIGAPSGLVLDVVAHCEGLQQVPLAHR